MFEEFVTIILNFKLICKTSFIMPCFLIPPEPVADSATLHGKRNFPDGVIKDLETERSSRIMGQTQCHPEPPFKGTREVGEFESEKGQRWQKQRPECDDV